MNQLRFRKGTPLPLGATKENESINFSVVAQNCEVCKLVLLHKKNSKKNHYVPLPYWKCLFYNYRKLTI